MPRSKSLIIILCATGSLIGVIFLAGTFLQASAWSDLHGANEPLREFYVEQHPPVDIVESIPAKPTDDSDQWYWQPGHWDNYKAVSQRSGKWEWMKGSWTKRVLSADDYAALGESEQWVPEHWVIPRGGGWSRVGGHNEIIIGLGEPHYAPEAPPEDIVEVKPPIPTETNFPPDRWFWEPGEWLWDRWHDKYEWVHGQWNVKTNDFYLFVPGRWEPHEGNGWKGWLWLKGFIEAREPDGKITAKF